LLSELQKGDVRHGRVSGLADFGVFVDLGGADGLVHLSELSWQPVSHPSDVVKVGDEVDVYVMDVDREKKRIALSLKRLQPEPWETIASTYQVGQLVQATITRLATFGAFARLQDGIEGLIHISELSNERIAHPKNVVNTGDVVTVKIVRIEPERRRLGLSLRQAQEDQEQQKSDGTTGTT
jgi:small subunit ribosomal protein S1